MSRSARHLLAKTGGKRWQNPAKSGEQTTKKPCKSFIYKALRVNLSAPEEISIELFLGVYDLFVA
jgi:hypothetical protein